MNSFLAALDFLTKNAGLCEGFAAGSSVATAAAAFASTGSGAPASTDDPDGPGFDDDDVVADVTPDVDAATALAYFADAGPST